PVINVLNKGQLTLNEEVNVSEATGMIKKEIVVEGQGSSVTLNGVLTGFDGGEVKVSNEGTVVLGEKVTGMQKVEVKMSNRRILLSNAQMNYDSNNNTKFIKVDEKTLHQHLN
ncbi:hypothetical protein, partial [Bartonella bovis]|uniref:hypothetical protein n=1 Tax=Bartonella bovis TaxID=155194 RepID=UPI00195BB114